MCIMPRGLCGKAWPACFGGTEVALRAETFSPSNPASAVAGGATGEEAHIAHPDGQRRGPLAQAAGLSSRPFAYLAVVFPALRAISAARRARARRQGHVGTKAVQRMAAVAAVAAAYGLGWGCSCWCR